VSTDPAVLLDAIREKAHEATRLPLPQALTTSPRELIDMALDVAIPLAVAAEQERIAGLLRAAESPDDIWAITAALTGEDKTDE
jgi:hypothetical protein